FVIAADGDGCAVRASLAGYRSDTIPTHELPTNPKVAALVLHRQGKYQGAAISATWLAAPEPAKLAFHAAIRGMRLGADGDYASAVKSLESAVELYPEYAAAWYELGSLSLVAGDRPAAQEALSKAIAADPWSISPDDPLLLITLAEQKGERARALCDRMLAMNPYLANAHYQRGLASLHLGEVDEAHKAAQAIEAGAEGKTFAHLHHLRGLIHENAGDIKEAAAEYWMYLRAEPNGSEARILRRRLAEWQVEGKIEVTQ
ncbi:MAG: tetratricopeptide repeat protein, partial [bacterium]|nr:tetratricopeptide repeat protein [bacterium]